MKVAICELCHAETRAGYCLDILYITGLRCPIPVCEECRELLRLAKERIDNNKQIDDINQKIRLIYLLRIAINHLQRSIYKNTTNGKI